MSRRLNPFIPPDEYSCLNWNIYVQGEKGNMLNMVSHVLKETLVRMERTELISTIGSEEDSW
jgi:hypothetical protein